MPKNTLPSMHQATYNQTDARQIHTRIIQKKNYKFETTEIP